MNGIAEKDKKGETSQYLHEIETYLKQLADETDEVKRSEFFRQYLETMSKFWRYRYHNQLLIFLQKPNATKVAGFRKWQEMNRWVKKGSKAIKILAPFVKKKIEINPKTGEEEEKIITYYTTC